MSSLGRNEENLDGRMEKVVWKILQTFMIHEQSGRERNGTKVAVRTRKTRRLDANGLCLVITKVYFIISLSTYHNHTTIHYDEHSTPEPISQNL